MDPSSVVPLKKSTWLTVVPIADVQVLTETRMYILYTSQQVYTIYRGWAMRLSKGPIFSSLLVLVLHTIPFAAPDDICYYVGGTGSERFNTVLELSDSTILLGGTSTNLAWIPSTVPRIQLLPTDKTGKTVPGYSGTSSIQNHYAFICRLTKDGSSILTVYHFPQDIGGTISSIKTNTPPGKPTGDIYICGTNGSPQMIWFGKLDKNILGGDPTGLQWIYKDVERAKSVPSWDVGEDGKIVYYQNNANRDWGIICRLAADGSKRDAVEKWYNHAFSDGGLSISLKPGNGDMRSLTRADYDLVTSDGHSGNSSHNRTKWSRSIAFFKRHIWSPDAF